jgi:nitrous oxidase accessory protein NosD
MAGRRGGSFVLAAALLLAPAVASAATFEVPAGEGNLAQALQAAAPGDTLRLAPGEHRGPVTVDRPLVDQIVWTQPLAKLLLNSPAVQLLRWAQSQFPALYPGGVVDTAPLMRLVEPNAGGVG